MVIPFVSRNTSLYVPCNRRLSLTSGYRQPYLNPTSYPGRFIAPCIETDNWKIELAGALLCCPQWSVLVACGHLRLVEGPLVGGVQDVGGLRQERGAQWLVAAENGGQVLGLLIQLLHLFPQGGVFLLQVLTLLKWQRSCQQDPNRVLNDPWPLHPNQNQMKSKAAQTLAGASALSISHFNIVPTSVLWSLNMSSSFWHGLHLFLDALITCTELLAVFLKKDLLNQSPHAGRLHREGGVCAFILSGKVTPPSTVHWPVATLTWMSMKKLFPNDLLSKKPAKPIPQSSHLRKTAILIWFL